MSEHRELPAGWATAPLRDIAGKIVDGSHIPPPPQPTGKPMLSGRNVLDDAIEFSEYRLINEKAFDLEHSRTRVSPGDVLLTIVGSIGRSAVVPAGLPDFTLQRSVAVIEPLVLLPRFCMYEFQSPSRQRWFQENARGTAQKGVYLKQLGELELAFAPAAEQERIVAKLDALLTDLDVAVAALKRVQANLKRYRASVLKAASEGRLVPIEAELARREGRSYETGEQLLARILKERRARWEADQLAKMLAAGKPPNNDEWKKKYKDPTQPDTTNLPELPEGWTWATAAQITSMITDGEHITPERTNMGVYLLSARNVRDGELSLDEVDFISQSTHEELCKRLTIEPGDVLLSCSGSVGRSCVVPDGIQFSLVRSVAVLKALIILPNYLCSCLRSGFLQGQIREKSTQTAQANIFQGKIRELILPVPPPDEQRRIVASCAMRLEAAARFSQDVVGASKRADRLRQAILKRAFEGKLVPQDPNDVPASALLARLRAERVSKTAMAANPGGKRLGRTRPVKKEAAC